MISIAQTLFIMSVPLLFATLGALISERAGVLAVFMDGAITLSGFIAIAVTMATGNPLSGFITS
ncbi:MAG TPA: ABC transporter permease, partial [Treponemataceae bacterium]|nr:ABC transporter permease [Treponemataceae bacterium]HQF72469.1 ABC transporter permease [Treponemataceae bacterium]